MSGRGRRGAVTAPWVKAALAIVLGIGAGVIAMELGVRWTFPEEQWRLRENSDDWKIDREIGWTNRPALDVVSRTEHGWTVRFRTNLDGIRPHTAERAARAGVKRVLIVGDSTVAGRSVPEADALHSQLQRLLETAGGEWEVLNAGVEGYSTDQSYLLLGRLLEQYQPDWVVHGVCENDLAGNTLSRAYGWAKARFELDSDAMLRYLPPVPPYGGLGRAAGPGVWIQRLAVYRIVQPYVFTLRMRLGDWEDRALAGLASETYWSREARERLDWRLFGTLLSSMAQSSEREGAGFLVYLHPELGAVWDPYVEALTRQKGIARDRYDPLAMERLVGQTAERAGARFVPMVRTFRERQREGPFHLLPRDPHSNPAGYALTAEILADVIRDQALRPDSGARRQ